MQVPNAAIPFFELKQGVLMNSARRSMLVALQLGTMLLVATHVAAQTPSPALLVLEKSDNTLAIVDPAAKNS